MPIPLKFQTSLDDAGFMAGIQRMTGAAKTFAGVLTGGAVAGGIKSLLDYGGQLRDSIDNTDLSAESFQRLSFAFSQSGVEQEKFVTGMQTLETKMQEAREGNQKTIDSFAKLGITVENLRNGTESVLGQIADGVKNAKQPAEALSASLDLLGKAGKRMQAGLKEGAEGLREIGAGVSTISGEALSKADKMGDDAAQAWREVKLGVLGALVALKDFVSYKPETKQDKDAAAVADYFKRMEQRKQEERVSAAKAAAEQSEIQKAERDEWVKLKNEQFQDRVKAREIEAQTAEQSRRYIEDRLTGAQKIKALERDIDDELARRKGLTESELALSDRKLVTLGNEIELEKKKTKEKELHKKLSEDEKINANAREFLGDAKGKLKDDTNNAVRQGLQTPAERRQEAMDAKREARELRRIMKIVDDPNARGGKKGDAKRAEQIRIDRRNVDEAKRMVQLSDASITKLVDEIEKLIVK